MDDSPVRLWRPSRRRRALGFAIMVPFSALTIVTVVQGFTDDEAGWSPGLIFVLFVFTVVSFLANVREWVRVTDAEILVGTSFGKVKRLRRNDVREIRAGRRLVQMVGADERVFVTIDRGVYSDTQLLEMASALGIPIRGPRRPKRLGRFENAPRERSA